MKTIFGIDLGTTNSCISMLKEGKPEVIAIQDSSLVPSIVSFEADEIIVGLRAKNRQLLHPENTISSVKRIIGSDETVKIGEKLYNPETISSYILSFLKSEAEKVCGKEVKNVVITVPAYFSDSQRRATQKAGEEAGLKVERIINEPTAAALFYKYLQIDEKSETIESNILVYDLGGGTFDVSVLRVGELNEVLATTGNTKLGGDDFDQTIMELCMTRIMREHGIDLRGYKPAEARLKAAAEQAKIHLSHHPYARIEGNLIPNQGNAEIDLFFELERSEFEEMIEHYLEITKKEVGKALSESGLTADQIQNVLLVGGSTRIPAVISLLEGYFGSSCLPPIDPDLSVAKGAAIQGGIITGEHIHQVLIDVNPHSLSASALSYSELVPKVICVPIIPRNTQIPVTRSQIFYTNHDEQQVVKVEVFQGESKEPSENTLIGSLDLKLHPSPAHSPIEIEYSYDLNGIIRVKVEQKGYGAKREVDLDSTLRGQSFLEFDLSIDDEDDFDPDDMDDTQEQDNQVTNYILHKSYDTLNELTSEAEKNTLKALIHDYEKALKGDDEDLVDETEEALVDYIDELKERGD
ncbi:Hsp70 family protein [Desulfonatronovibrio magnus]|uniref:Hsp70 family protein n=1 Tax=Desulfonatronovibrio magnus TaxID=698827 RepID=UPI0005EB7F66|nr:Hsp70 family protein [Desulfonatronovibrio magnus]